MAIDIAKWLTENMQALNLTDDEKAMAQKLASGDFGKRLGASVYPQQSVSDLQSTLDKELNAKRELEAANIAWQEQFFKDLSELGALDRLQAAGFDVSGLQQTRGGGVQNREGQTLSASDINALIEKKAAEIAARAVEPVRTSNLEYAEFIAVVAPDYVSQFGKRFEPKKFRDFAYEHHKEYANLQQAYDAYTADDRKAKEEEAKKKWEADKEKEIELRVMSRMQIPEMSPESGSGGPFDIAMHTPAAAAAASGASGTATPPQVSREDNRQAFARKFQDTNFSGL